MKGCRVETPEGRTGVCTSEAAMGLKGMFEVMVLIDIGEGEVEFIQYLNKDLKILPSEKETASGKDIPDE